MDRLSKQLTISDPHYRRFCGLVKKSLRKGVMTQKALAETCGVPAKHIRNVERKKGQLSFILFVRICRALELDFADVFKDPPKTLDKIKK